MDTALATGYQAQPYAFTYSAKDTILYNIAVGASTVDEDGLRFLYEDHPLFSPLPTLGVLPGLAWLTTLVEGGVPGIVVDLDRVLHGEQYMKIKKPLPAEGTLTNVFKIQDMLDKGSGMVLLVAVESKDEAGEVVLHNQVSLFIVGAGGWGGPRTSVHTIDIIKSPSRAPDAATEYQTTADQAALYRMTGDLNPLHISPEAASLLGFKKPILHGLCSLGISVRQVVATFANNDPSRVQELKVRMSRPVVPGQKLRTEMWLQDVDMVIFRTLVVETGEVCLDGGWVRIDKKEESH